MRANKRINDAIRIRTHSDYPDAYVLEVVGDSHFTVNGTDSVSVSLKAATLLKIAEFVDLIEEGRAVGLTGETEV